MKRWILVSMLLVGISLAVYAIAPKVMLTNIMVENITSTTADLIVGYAGATKIYFYASYTPNGMYYPVASVDAIDEGTHPMVTYNVGGLTPDTTYYIQIQAVGLPDPDNPNNVNRANSYTSFRTLPQ